MIKLKFSGQAERGITNVYVMSCGVYCKIGIADDVAQRQATLQCGNPHAIGVELAIEIRKELGREVEAWAHSILSDRRHRGEWFKVSRKAAKRAVMNAVKKYEDHTSTSEMTRNERQAAYAEAFGTC